MMIQKYGLHWETPNAGQKFKIPEFAGMEFCEGTIEGKDIVIVQCGIGKVNAGMCANTLINNFNCTKIINTGLYAFPADDAVRWKVLQLRRLVI